LKLEDFIAAPEGQGTILTSAIRANSILSSDSALKNGETCAAIHAQTAGLLKFALQTIGLWGRHMSTQVMRPMDQQSSVLPSGAASTPPASGHARALAALALGAFALGAFAIGAVAIGRMAIGRVAIGRARIRRMEIDELSVRHLRITGSLHTPLGADSGMHHFRSTSNTTLS